MGGLSVLQHVRAVLPRESLLYVADSGHAPYGGKPVDFIVRRSLAITEFLLEQQAKASGGGLQHRHGGGYRSAARLFFHSDRWHRTRAQAGRGATRSGVVGILATGNTVRSDKFAALLDQHGQRAR